MDGVGISIIGRPRPLPGHDTPNPAHNTHTLNYEEPLNAGAEALGFWVVEAPIDAVVVTVAAALGALPGTGQTTVKVTPFECYPSKGRGGQGVRCQRFLRGEDRLDIAWVGTKPARAASADGSPVELPAEDERRDGSGVPITFAIASIG